MAEDAGIYARHAEHLDRYVQIGVAGDRVLAVSFPKTPDDGAAEEHPLLDRIDAYLRGDQNDFGDVTVALTMATDRRGVLERLREVPYGERTTVERLARMVPGLSDDDPDDQRLVREALDDNPAPIFVPDHRVSDGPSGAPADVVQKLQALEGL